MTLAKRNRSLSNKRNFLRKPRKNQISKPTMQQSNNLINLTNSFNKKQHYSHKLRPKTTQNIRYQKSKPINITNQQSNIDTNNLNYTNFRHKRNKFNNISSINFDPNNTAAAAVQLAQLIRNELTINLTKDQPRLLNPNPNSFKPYHELRPFELPNQFAKLQVQNGNGIGSGLSAINNNNFKLNLYRYQNNRFKYIKPNSSVKNNAPYNTTQYIMYDYSKRTPHDQVCPNEQQQFSDEWNMALANSDVSTSAAFSLSFGEEDEHRECSLNKNTTKLFSKSEENLSQQGFSINEEPDHSNQIDSIFQLSTSL